MDKVSVLFVEIPEVHLPSTKKKQKKYKEFRPRWHNWDAREKNNISPRALTYFFRETRFGNQHIRNSRRVT